MVDLPDPESRHRLQVDIGRPPQRVGDHAGTHRLVGKAIDQNEAASLAAFGIAIKGQG